jgi:hypothetical protein
MTEDGNKITQSKGLKRRSHLRDTTRRTCKDNIKTELKISILPSVPEIRCVLFYKESSMSPCEQVRNASNSIKGRVFFLDA